MSKIDRIMITDSFNLARSDTYTNYRIYVGAADAEEDIEAIKDILLKHGHLAPSADVRTKFVKMNNVRLTSAYTAVNMKVVTAWQLNAQKNEIMRGWQFKEPEYKKPWWRFW